jgi:hypothetical protein
VCVGRLVAEHDRPRRMTGRRCPDRPGARRGAGGWHRAAGDHRRSVASGPLLRGQDRARVVRCGGPAG